MFKKDQLLFVILAGFFVSNALIAEFMGVKVFSLEATLGLDPIRLNLFGVKDLGFNLTAGVLLWPVVFVMTDVINDYYGVKGVRVLSLLASVLISYGFLMFLIGMHTVPAGFWPTSHIPIDATPAQTAEITSKVADMDYAYKLIFGQGLWIIIGSLIAFLIGQILDAYVFKAIKRATGDGRMWLRSTVSTLVSQFIDSFVVLFVAFYLGGNWTLSMVFAIGVVNYVFKFVVALTLIPALYGIHALIEAYLGKELAARLRHEAIASKEAQ
jgi:queuosine precursor transporter